MSEMIERVARAIAPSAFKTLELPKPPHPGVPADYGETSYLEPGYVAAAKTWSRWMNARVTADRARLSARRAIEAMRELTPEMVTASGSTDDRGFHVNDFRNSWGDAINAALILANEVRP